MAELQCWGRSTGSDKGGPATIYALVSDWGGSVDIRGGYDRQPEQSDDRSWSVKLFDRCDHDRIALRHPIAKRQFTMNNSTGTNCCHRSRQDH
jgi:hypothetical protein